MHAIWRAFVQTRTPAILRVVWFIKQSSSFFWQLFIFSGQDK